jgi:WD40 repeat protein
VRLRDADSGRELRVFEGHGASVMSVAFSPDGRRLASAGDDGSVRLWDADSGRELRVLEGHRGSVMSVAFSPDGRRLASAGEDRSVRLWDAVSGEPQWVLAGTVGGWIAMQANTGRYRGSGHLLSKIAYIDPNETPPTDYDRERSGPWEPTRWLAEDLPEFDLDR